MRYAQMPTPPPCMPGEQLPIDRITPRPSLHRVQEPGSLEALAESIQRWGLVRPVIVRRTGMGRYAIVSGNRRLMACRHLGMSCIGVRVLPEDARWQSADRLLETLLTRRLHYLEEAQALRALHDAHDLAWDVIARTLNAPADILADKAALTTLEDELQALLLEEGVPQSIALMLCRLPGKKRRMCIAERIVLERPCIRDAVLLIAAELRGCKNEVVNRDELLPEESCDQDRVENGRIYGENEVWKQENVEAHRGNQHIIGLIRDPRLYLNSIRDIARQMQEAGFRATVDERQSGALHELVIRVPVRRRRADRYQSI